MGSIPQPGALPWGVGIFVCSPLCLPPTNIENCKQLIDKWIFVFPCGSAVKPSLHPKTVRIGCCTSCNPEYRRSSNRKLMDGDSRCAPTLCLSSSYHRTYKKRLQNDFYQWEAMSRSQLCIDVDVQGSLNSKQLDKSSPKMLSSSIGVFGLVFCAMIGVQFLCWPLSMETYAARLCSRPLRSLGIKALIFWLIGYSRKLHRVKLREQVVRVSFTSRVSMGFFLTYLQMV